MLQINSPEADSKEREALKQFREAIPDILQNFNVYKRHDFWLRRWLRAREQSVPKAEEMIRKSMKWRVDQNINTIMEWTAPDCIGQEYPVIASGFDKDGCLVAIVPFGHWDVREAVGLGLKADLLRYIDQIFEQAMRLVESRSRPEHYVIQFVMILDFEDFSLRQLASRETIETIIEIIRRLETNHPETMKVAWVINAPKIFEVLFAVLKPRLTARMISKVRVFGSNTEQWRAALLQNIEPDQLPSQYGGSNTSCKNYKVRDGFDVFPVNEVYPAEEMVEVTVEAGGLHLVEFELSKGSKLSWNFRTTDYDIGFHIRYDGNEKLGLNKNKTIRNHHHKDKEENKYEKLFPCSRADSHLHLQKGSLVAEQSGTYTLAFDNSFSRFRSKTLLYAARVLANSQPGLNYNN